MPHGISVNISLIVAMAPGGVIGAHGMLPWPAIEEDLQFYKEKTLGKAVIMGIKTLSTLPKAAMDGRTTILLTRRYHEGQVVVPVLQAYPEAYPEAHPEAALAITEKKAYVANSMSGALRAAMRLVPDADEIMVAGGAQVYEAALPYATRMYITNIHRPFWGDTHFPQWDRGEWVKTSHRESTVSWGRYGKAPIDFQVWDRREDA